CSSDLTARPGAERWAEASVPARPRPSRSDPAWTGPAARPSAEAAERERPRAGRAAVARNAAAEVRAARARPEATTCAPRGRAQGRVRGAKGHRRAAYKRRTPPRRRALEGCAPSRWQRSTHGGAYSRRAIVRWGPAWRACEVSRTDTMQTSTWTLERRSAVARVAGTRLASTLHEGERHERSRDHRRTSHSSDHDSVAPGRADCGHGVRRDRGLRGAHGALHRR